MLIYGHDAAIAEWVAERTDIREFGPCVAIGVSDRWNTRLLAGVVYNCFFPEYGTMQVTIAADSPMWARRDNIKELLSYPFLQAGAYKLWAATPVDNKAALDVNSHLGFTREAVLAHHFGKNRHAVISRLLKPAFDRLYGSQK